MSAKNSKEKYGRVTKAFHWLTAVLVIMLLAMGLVMDDLPLSIKLPVYNLHKSLGVTVLCLTFARIFWHLYSQRPHAVATLTLWEKRLSVVMHEALYPLMILMPLSGWMMSSAAGRPVKFFGLFTMPDLVQPDQSLAKILRDGHEFIGYALMLAAGLHALAALKHHFIDKDSVLKRMLPVLLLCLLPWQASAAPNPKDQWNIVFESQKSTITFRAKQMGQEFKGSFGLFGGTIYFNPDDLANSSADIKIDLSKISTGAADRDETTQGKDWFDVTSFPYATFHTTAIRNTGVNLYEADGTLTIKNIAQTFKLPFQLVITTSDSGKKTATMDASITLDRSKFQLGTGEWADPSTVANDVVVDIHLVAVPAN